MANHSLSRRAAQYLRMSTENQDLSLEFQRAINAAYALEHGFEIVRSYTDAGISGLGFNNRPGLTALLADVMASAADFAVVLVYDVSRWGRFQNPDQAAHYEFICAEAGVSVAYCAEPFDNDGSPTSTLIKQ
jgi:DNA invertase Pin-like site-specific DNA recombinase